MSQRQWAKVALARTAITAAFILLSLIIATRGCFKCAWHAALCVSSLAPSAFYYHRERLKVQNNLERSAASCRTFCGVYERAAIPQCECVCRKKRHLLYSLQQKTLRFLGDACEKSSLENSEHTQTTPSAFDLQVALFCLKKFANCTAPVLFMPLTQKFAPPVVL